MLVPRVWSKWAQKRVHSEGLELKRYRLRGGSAPAKMSKAETAPPEKFENRLVEPAILHWSSPETWVTQCTGHMGDTFGPNGWSSGSSTRVSKSKYPKS